MRKAGFGTLVEMHEQDIWTGTSRSATILRTVLTPLSWLYSIGWQSYLAMYKAGLKKAIAPHHPVVCVGNLQVGGSGKTPVTRRIAEILAEEGIKVVIGCSGYGSPRAEAASVAPDGPLDPSDWGDEPALFRWLLPDVPLIVGRRRVLAAELAAKHYPNHVLLMDDGFQHLPLQKDLTILLDPAQPVNERCLPAGPYREPRSNRSRADLVLPGRFQVVELPMRLATPNGDLQTPERYSVLCAIGQPDRFIDSLGRQYPNAINDRVIVRASDHDPLNAGNLFDALPKGVPVVVTAKDWVKIRQRPDWESREFLIASHDIRIEPEVEFKSWLIESIYGKSR
jgi:tetraacyldisaccharide 4'-kinase